MLLRIFDLTQKFFLAILLGAIFSDSVSIQQNIIKLFSWIPIDFWSILLMNALSLALIYVLGFRFLKAPVFFCTLNGVMLGVFIRIYSQSLDTLFQLLFPHAMFETIALILFCASVQEIHQAFQIKNFKQINSMHRIIMFVSIPLFFVALLFEVF